MTPSTSSSVQDRVVHDLSGKIADGRLAPGRKLPTTRELADTYGVAVQTAHQAMRELVERGLVERSPGRGSFVLGRPGAAPRTRVIGLLTATAQPAGQGFFAAFLQEMMHRQFDLRVVDTCGVDDLSIARLPAMDRLRDAQPELIVAQSGAMARALHVRLPQIPIIASDPTPQPSTIHSVCPAHAVAGRLGAACLLASGLQRLAFCGVELTSASHHRFLSYEDREQYDSFRWELDEHGRGDHCQLLHLYPGEDPEHALALLRRLSFPTAIYCSRPPRAVQLAKAAATLGLRIPQDLVLVAGGDSPTVAALDLTALDLRHDVQARACADLIDDLLRHPHPDDRQHQLRIPPHLIPRHSCPIPAHPQPEFQP